MQLAAMVCDRDNYFEIVLPVNYAMPDGSIITVEDEEGWYAENPDSAWRSELQYPVDVTFQDGSTLTLNSEEEMREACSGKGGTLILNTLLCNTKVAS